MILVVGSSSYGSVLTHLNEIVYANGLKELASIGVDVAEIDMVMFTGGEDVHPDLYSGSDPDHMSGTNKSRDIREMELFEELKRLEVKITGICRGFQFINVMAGGEMYQHVFNHAGMVHEIYYPATEHLSAAMSTHHQMVKPDDLAIPVAWSVPSRSHAYWGPKGVIAREKPFHEIESAIFPNINGFGVQYHPEMMREDTEGRQYYLKLIADFYNMDLGTFTDMYGGIDEWRGKVKTTSTE